MAKAELGRGYGNAALAVAIWAGFIVVARMGGGSALTAYDITAVRYVTAAAILLPVWLVQRRCNLLDPRLVALAVVGGLLYSLLVFSGFESAPASHAAVLLPGLLPFGIALLAWLMLAERPSAARQAGLAVMAAGLVCLGAELFQAGAGSWRGDLLLVAASAAWALYTVLVRRFGVSPWDVTVAGALWTALLYLPVYLLFLPKQLALATSGEIALQAFYQGVLAVIVQMVCYMRAVALIGPNRLGSMMALVPVIAGVAAVPLLGESLSPWLCAGLTLVSAGAWLGNRSAPIARPV